MPSVMRLLGAAGGFSNAEVRSTFNGGLGMVCVVPAGAVEETISSLEDDGLEAWHVGEVAEADAGGPSYLES
jgi:phosphoribosylformylglycinamidine cyclo-ligase